MIFFHRSKASKIVIILRVLIIHSCSEIFHLIDGFTLFVGRFSALSSSSSTAIKSFVDFSSTEYWEEFYQKEEEEEGQEETTSSLAIAGVSRSSSSSSTLEKEVTATEWHSSISLDDIASMVPQNGRCLIIGCGNSLLPDVILQQRQNPPGPPKSLVLLDSSPTCLDQLRERYQNTTYSKIDTAIDYICGDVTRLSKYFDIGDEDDDNDDNDNDDDDDDNNNRRGGGLFDIIIDKGLTDAILCGEGWDYLLEKVLYESSKILSKDGSGRYLLISYQLPSSTKDFLIDVGKQVGLEWEFDYDLNFKLTKMMTPDATSDLPSSSSTDQYSSREHPRVSVAMARKNTDIVN
jgi:hypothetical protein